MAANVRQIPSVFDHRFCKHYQDIPESNPIRFCLSFFPLIGDIFSVIAQNSLIKSMASCEDPARSVELLQVRDNYSEITLIRSMVTCVGVIAMVAAGILNGWVALLCIPCIANSMQSMYEASRFLKHHSEIVHAANQQGPLPRVF